MRDIKFRGLRVEGKGWVYGDLQHNEIKDTWISKLTSDFNDVGGVFENVTLKSVGQFTERQDKNGVDIYEGDEDERGLIQKRYGCFILVHNPTCRADEEGECRWDYLHLFESSELEVIGNIHENK